MADFCICGLHPGEKLMIILRCDAGPEIGFGHLVRCRELARELHRRGEQCTLLGPSARFRQDDDPTIFHDWIEVESWSSASQDARTLVEVATAKAADFAVLDDYRVDESYQLVLRDAGIRWLQIEYRTHDPIWASLLLNATPSADPEAYDVRDPGARLLLGPRYVILRPEFVGLGRRSSAPRARRVLVAFGAGDDRGGVEFVLSSLLPTTSEALEFVVLSGRHNPANVHLQEWIAANGGGRVSLSIDPESVPRLMGECDLAVTSGGTLTYELAACEVPMIIIAISANQWTSKGWQDLGCGLFLGDLQDLTPERFAGKFMERYEHEDVAWCAAKKARDLVDGLGCARVVDEILREVEDMR